MCKSLQGFLPLNRILPGWYQNCITQEATMEKKKLTKCCLSDTKN